MEIKRYTYLLNAQNIKGPNVATIQAEPNLRSLTVA
jgi:hypothetical protein